MGPDPASSAVAKGTPTAPLPQAAVCATKVNRGSSGLLTGRPPTIIAWAISRPLTTVNSGQSGTPPDNGSASSAPSTGIPYAPSKLATRMAGSTGSVVGPLSWAPCRSARCPAFTWSGEGT